MRIAPKTSFKMISNEPPLTHTNPLFANNHMLKLFDVHTYCVSLYVYNNLANYENFSTHGYNIRTNSHIRSVACRTVLSQRRLSYIGPVVWNNLPLTIKSAPNLNSLKSKLKQYFLSTYNS